MRRASAGFTLLEVLAALLVVTVGLLGFAGTLGPVARLAGEGRMRGRAALIMASRISRLRTELQAKAPACVPPAAGSLQHPSGISESWSLSLASGVVELRIAALLPRSRGGAADTLITHFPCP